MIRAKNIDYNSTQMKLHSTVNIGPCLSATESICFVAPYHCIVESASFYPSVAITATLTSSLFLTTATGSLLADNGSAAAGQGEKVSFNITSNNSLTAGTALSLSVTTTATGGFGGGVVHVVYVPKVHGEDT